MIDDRAINLLTTTFDQPFSVERYTRFMQELLNDVDTSKSFQNRSGNIIPQGFRGHISKYTRPFVYYDPQGQRIDVLLVRLSKPSALDRARTMQRNFIAHYLSVLDHAEPIDAALVAFYHEDVPDWRFSLVQIEYRFAEEGGIEESLTPARRYSYLVGPTEPTHTAEQQLLPFLLDSRNNPTLAQITQAFQIEKVSEQFFEAYKGLFLQLAEAIQEVIDTDAHVRDEFEYRHLSVPDFAKKLLGQIVFLYFLQKKGWLGVAQGEAWGTGPKDFLRRLFDAHTNTNLFDGLLEPLFYDALAIDRQRDDNWFPALQCKIPFLNGGLFEPMNGYDWRRTNLTLPNTLFSNRQHPRDEQATGILDVFDRYNFTVREEEPLDKEVAVDPEMLGKVFENLLEVQDRKSKGAFYTPREIVHYMCQESLINYLDTTLNWQQQALQKPQQQSLLPELAKPQQKGLALGERVRVERVPRADLTVLVRQGALALQQDAAKEAGLQKRDYILPQTVRNHAQALDEALAEIKLCDPAIGSGAFPVGMLHEIVQARLALDTQLKRGTPAYDLKRHAIQTSIYGVDLDVGAVEIAKLRLWLSLVVDEESYDQISPLPNLDYKIVQGNALLGVDTKQVTLFNNAQYVKLNELKATYFNATDRRDKERLQAQINLLLEGLTGSADTFDFEIYFQEVFAHNDGFDLILGNPPYVRMELIKEYKPELKTRYNNVYSGRADLYVYFYAQGINLLRPHGTLAYITSNKFMRSGYGKKLRTFLSSKTNVHAVIDFGDLSVFEATAYPTIVITYKEAISTKNRFQALTVDNLTILQQLPQNIDNLAWLMPQRSLLATGWALVRPNVLALMENLRKKGQPLQKHLAGKFYFGVKTGLNEAFVIDESVRQQLIAQDSRSTEIIKPWLRGRDIKKWIVKSSDLYIIFVKHGIDINKYPAIEKYLKQFKKKLEKRATSHLHPWYEIQQPQMGIYEKFSSPKIVYQEISTYQSFAYIDEEIYMNNKCYFIPDAPLFLLAILNSKMNWFFLKQIVSKLRGDAFTLQSIYVGQIPIVTPHPDQQLEIEAFVQGMLDNPTPEQAVHIEKRLNQLVYQLYELTSEEIALIEAQVGG